MFPLKRILAVSRFPPLQMARNRLAAVVGDNIPSDLTSGRVRIVQGIMVLR